MALDGRRVAAGLILAASAGLAAARVGAAPIGAAAAVDAVVLAAVDIHQVVASRHLYAIVHPIALVVQGRYRDAVISGEDVTRLRAEVPRSVLHRVPAFTLYDRGRRLGTARVERVAVSPDHTLHCLPSVAGFGSIQGDRPLDLHGAHESTLYLNARAQAVPESPSTRAVETRMRRVVGLSGPARFQAFFVESQRLTASQRRLLVPLARREAQAAARRSWRGVGRVVLRGDVRFGPATLVDTDRDGAVEAAGVVVAPLRRPARARFPGEPAPALEVLLVAGLAERGPPAVRLSLPGLVGLGPDVAESHLLQTVLDLDGDGRGELVVLHGYSYEDVRYEIYRLRGDRFIRIFAGGYQGC